MKKISEICQIVIFMLMITGGMILQFAMPDKHFSENENRILESRPSCSMKKVKDGKWMKEWDKYLTDQFPYRDNWIGLKAYCEIMSGKTENNGVYFCKGDTLIKRFEKTDEKLLADNIKAVNELSEKLEIPIWFSLIPGSVSIWKERLPDYAWNEDQEKMIQDIYTQIDCSTVDNYAQLYAHKDEQIYYRTDHHWTTLGGYYGYIAVMKAMGKDSVEFSNYQPETVSNRFYGTVYSASGVRWIKPDRIEKYVSDKGKMVEKIVGETVMESVFYDYEKLAVKDKYAFFFGGNAPLLRITGDRSEEEECKGGSLLVIRDSYSDCEIPFFTDNFEEIWMMDLRYYKFGISYFLSQHPVDAILINYSLVNFIEDKNIAMLAG